MKKLYIVFLVCVLLPFGLVAQSLVQTVPLPNNTFYNSGYGLVCGSTDEEIIAAGVEMGDVICNPEP